MKTSKLVPIAWMFFFLPATSLGSEVFQWTDSRGVIHFTDDYSRIAAGVRGTPDVIIRHSFAESEQKTPAVVTVTKEPVGGDKREYERLGREDAYEPKEKYSNDASADTGASENVTIVVVNNSVHKKPCRGHACSGRFQPNFNDRRYIHPDVFNGGTRQYIQPNAFNGGSRHFQASAAGFKRK